ncbi:hypothetical protein TrLO_g11434 [Triparma laevis f. longispina]|uniref:aspartate-semialdehyde dehydrogenase n=1 Tax=Triparma laevis f. longispina TaxID=1714387 RepID=A0A9W6ZUN9_9STRA|nr:hypothetical protein TrLO_g11434 [Triparma laevis f. longispina]
MKFSAITLLALLTGASAFVPTSKLSGGFGQTRMQKATALAAVVGVVGATGAVGKEVVGCLEQRNFPVDKLRIFGSARSAGSTVSTKFGDVTVELFDQASAKECDVCFLAVSGDFALEHAREISKDCIVIDNSSAFRYEDDVPLVIPEINGKTCKGKKLIANPNCTTAIGLMGLSPLMKKFGAKRVLMSTYQASSGAGQEGMDELKAGSIQVTSGEREFGKSDHKHFTSPLPFNVIPHIDKFQENGYTKEEMKVTWETRKICEMADDFPVSCTAVRIPTFRAHSETIVLETTEKVDVKAAQELLAKSPGVKLVDDIANNKYPMPLTATGQYDVEVGRVRRSEAFGDYGLEFFVSGDQLLRGAALNAVLVAEECVKNGDL